MNTICPPTKNFINPFEAAAMLRRLVANLRGFAYRRRPDDEWTMEWVTDGIHTITGYESHRFFHNQSLSFAQLIHPEDKPRVEADIAYALESRHRTTVTYRVTTAPGARRGDRSSGRHLRRAWRAHRRRGSRRFRDTRRATRLR